MTGSTPPFDAFLSYHSADAEWVHELKRGLEARGVRVWLDSEQIRPGDVFPGALAQAIGGIRCLVIVLSAGSAASPWVQEEFNLALAHQCRVIAALIDDVELPGFLKGRTYADFRDEREFERSVDILARGILGQPAPDGAAAGIPDYRSTSAPAPGADEAEVLKRLIERSRRRTRPLWQARWASAMTGLTIGTLPLFSGAETSTATRLTILIVTPLVLTLIAWGITATRLAQLRARLEQFELLRDGLEACRSRSHPQCRRLRQRLWDMIDRTAAELTARPV